MIDRYAKVPLSDKAKEGMKLTIDDLAAISRLLTLQDDAYDEQFSEIKEFLKWQKESILIIIKSIQEMQSDIHDLKNKVNDLDEKVGKIQEEVKCTKGDIEILRGDLEKIRGDVEKLKKINGLL